MTIYDMQIEKQRINEEIKRKKIGSKEIKKDLTVTCSMKH